MPFSDYSPSVSMGSPSMGSTNLRSKIFERIPESSKKQKLEFVNSCSNNYLHSKYTVLGIISNLEMI